jgi:hypothetical protein
MEIIDDFMHCRKWAYCNKDKKARPILSKQSMTRINVPAIKHDNRATQMLSESAPFFEAILHMILTSVSSKTQSAHYVKETFYCRICLVCRGDEAKPLDATISSPMACAISCAVAHPLRRAQSAAAVPRYIDINIKEDVWNAPIPPYWATLQACCS